MKNIFILFALVIAATSTFAQAIEREIGNYSELHVAGDIEIILVPQASPKAQIEMKKGLAANINTTVTGNVLRISVKPSTASDWGNNDAASITLGYKNITCLDAKAGASIRNNETLKSNALDIDVSAGSAMHLMVNGDMIDIKAQAGASLILEGTCRDMVIKSDSGSSVDALKLVCDDVTANAASGSSIKTHVTSTFKASSSTGSSIIYSGNPSTTDLDTGTWSDGRISKL